MPRAKSSSSRKRKETPLQPVPILKPEPFQEEKDPNRWWAKEVEEDEWEKLLPTSKGFLSDFLYAMRESEVPTAFVIWGALFAIAAVLRRETWIKWFRGKSLFASFYLFLVGPPSTKKSFVVEEVMDLLNHLESGLKTDISKQTKEMTIINSATPELIEDTLAKLSEHVVEFPNGDKYHPGAAAVIAAPELARFLGKQKYGEGKLPMLLDLYDCRDTIKVGTLARGWKILRNTHLMFIAATTKQGMKDSVPQATVGDGFLSRTVIIHQDRTKKRRSLPPEEEIAQAPTKWDLIERLGWIAENVTKEHTFSKEAREYYDKWYNEFKDTVDQMGEEVSPVYSRIDLDVVKVSLLMKAQRYGLGQVIEKQDVEDAIRLVEATIKTSPEVVTEVAGDDIRRVTMKISNYIQRRQKIDRRKLMQNTGFTAPELSRPLDYLLQTGKIAVHKNGDRTDVILREHDEIYEWLG